MRAVAEGRNDIMEMKSRPLKPGAKAWMSELGAYPLPKGLSDRQVVTIISFPGHRGIVEDANGQRWEVVHPQVDPGRPFRAQNGRWYDETHPAALKGLAVEIKRYQATGNPRLEETIHRLQWIIDRNAQQSGDHADGLSAI